MKVVVTILMVLAMVTPTVQATSLQMSLGIRETNSAGAIFGDGGSSEGIEHVRRDEQTLTLNGTWQLFTFTPASDTLTAFAGTTANSILEPGLQWATIEHIRILNDQGITQPVRLWIDDITNHDANGPVTEGYDSWSMGDEVMFQEPTFSGSTNGNLMPLSASQVTDTTAFSGSQSLQVDFQFIDDNPTRWVRLTTFGTDNLPNPRILVRQASGGPVSISFWAKAEVIPEPTSLLLLGTAGVICVSTRRRRR